LNSKTIQNYCDSLLSAIQSSASEDLFRKAAGTVNDVRIKLQNRDQPERSKVFTAALIDAAATRNRAPAASQRVTGTVKDFNEIKGYGFITADDGGDVFVHYTAIVGTGYRYLMKGERVQFAIAPSPKGPVATGVELMAAAQS
jgi:CspA family cold shock protein